MKKKHLFLKFRMLSFRNKNLNPKINAYLEVFEKESNSDAKKADSYINNGNKDILLE